MRVEASPLDPHSSTPQELRDRLTAEAAGEPFLVHRDAEGLQHITPLAGRGGRLTLGRSDESDLPLPWDGRVSRAHAELQLVAGDWAVIDDGLSRNGTWVNGERVAGRRRLRDADVLRVGDTALAFRAPSAAAPGAGPTVTADGADAATALTPAQRRVLVALCRPYRDSAFATPASNPQIAEELCVSVEAVRTTMRALFASFGIEHLPQNQKRASLALQALRSGALSRRDL